jgi:hypothetical protein
MSRFYFEIINNSHRYILTYIFFQIIMSYLLTGSITCFIISFIVMAVMYIIHSKVTFLLIPLLIIFYLESVLLNLYLNSHFNPHEIRHINTNFKYSNLSLFLSVVFIVIIFLESELTRIYYEIHQRIFYLKVLLDILLLVSYVYNLYGEFKGNYLEFFDKSYYIIFLLFTIHYLIIYFTLFSKLNFKIDEKTIVSYFPAIKTENNLYNKNTPYFEMKFNKVRLIIIFIF